MSDDRAKPRAWITGASSGIGAALAQEAARRGHDVVLVARDNQRLATVARHIGADHGVEARTVRADLSVDDDVARVAAAIGADERCALLVNAAGFGANGAFAATRPEAIERMIRVHVLALVRLTRAAVEPMLERGHGAIINVSSAGAAAPLPFDATYGATKAYVRSFNEALFEELRGSGIRCLCLCPGFTRTAFHVREGVDASFIPRVLWHSPEFVARAAFRALERGRAVFTPGVLDAALFWLSSLMPASLSRRLVAGVLRSVPPN